MPWSSNSERTSTTEHKRWAQAVKRRDHYTCQQCGYRGTPGKADVEADHILPTTQGGANTLGNGTTLCLDCHKPKTQAEAAVGRARKSRTRTPRPHPGLRST